MWPTNMNQTTSHHYKRSSTDSRVGFTVLELLVVVAIIGVLIALLMPAIGSAREAARRLQCTNHLREIGLAMQNHHSTENKLPVGWSFSPGSTSAYGWVVPLLPYIEQGALAEQIDRKRPLNDPRHQFARSTSLDWMLCPSDITEPFFTLYQDDEEHDEGESFSPVERSVALMQLPTANYVGIFGTIEADDCTPAPVGDGAFLENHATRFRDFQRGTSHTIIVGERTMAQVPSTWIGVNLAGEDAAARLVGSALEGINNPLADECDHSSRHPGGANFLWGDGHVTFVTENVDLHEYHRWAKLRE
ncbi:protein containing DUF1559 [Rhodopirellula baltica SH28]|uniref:Protein containing DUF1559 n=3 Tax=Rhodopirellula baltica TaxID=265606 RepID=F2AYF8_RHOBT|nr:protein containing DUF1559 [Rhodopirellula baltica WH47]EKK02759.1 protein containing DUF1559 [Rhodopirellula baltica SH28]